MALEEQPKDFNDSCENTLVKESEDTAQTENKTKAFSFIQPHVVGKRNKLSKDDLSQYRSKQFLCKTDKGSA